MLKKLLLVFVLATPVFGAESVSLNTPLVVDPRSASTLYVRALILYWGDNADQSYIGIQLSDGNIVKDFSVYKGPAARNLMNALNKANLTTNSLEKRIFNQLISDGYLNGTVVGSPD